jgi:hypothetical protein
MNAKECHARAAECAANAAIAANQSDSTEFLKLAAQWRAMAVRENVLGHVEDRPALPSHAEHAVAAPSLVETQGGNVN